MYGLHEAICLCKVRPRVILRTEQHPHAAKAAMERAWTSGAFTCGPWEELPKRLPGGTDILSPPDSTGETGGRGRRTERPQGHGRARSTAGHQREVRPRSELGTWRSCSAAACLNTGCLSQYFTFVLAKTPFVAASGLTRHSFLQSSRVCGSLRAQRG